MQRYNTDIKNLSMEQLDSLFKLLSKTSIVKNLKSKDYQIEQGNIISITDHLIVVEDINRKHNKVTVTKFDLYCKAIKLEVIL